MRSAHGNKQKHESKNPFQRALIGRFHGQLARLVGELAPAEILDVGCGEGYVLAALREAGIRCPMTGIDRSAEAVAAARARVPEASFAVTDALALADLGQRFDLVLMTEVLEHLPEPERMLAVLESLAKRYVVTSVPWEPYFRGINFLRGKHVLALGNDPEHINHWGRASFLGFMAQRFAVRKAPWVFPWTLVAAQRR
ncbi:MAG TPA: methyltransferase domain-containing protein [Polyangiales bacterium]|nr:methyltransferase domain-containing protein [Polyangiales bacterium]